MIYKLDKNVTKGKRGIRERTIKCDVFDTDTYYDIAERFAQNFGDPGIIDGMLIYSQDECKRIRELKERLG